MTFPRPIMQNDCQFEPRCIGRPPEFRPLLILELLSACHGCGCSSCLSWVCCKKSGMAGQPDTKEWRDTALRQAASGGEEGSSGRHSDSCLLSPHRFSALHCAEVPCWCVWAARRQSECSAFGRASSRCGGIYFAALVPCLVSTTPAAPLRCWPARLSKRAVLASLCPYAFVRGD